MFYLLFMSNVHLADLADTGIEGNGIHRTSGGPFNRILVKSYTEGFRGQILDSVFTLLRINGSVDAEFLSANLDAVQRFARVNIVIGIDKMIDGFFENSDEATVRTCVQGGQYALFLAVIENAGFVDVLTYTRALAVEFEAEFSKLRPSGNAVLGDVAKLRAQLQACMNDRAA